MQEVHREGQDKMYLVYLNTPFTEKFERSEYKDLRQDEKDTGEYLLDYSLFEEAGNSLKVLDDPIPSKLKFEATLSTREIAVFTAGLSLGRTIFVCIVLTCGALYFSKDANDYAIGPIEVMIQKLQRISRNPISAKDEDQ